MKLIPVSLLLFTLLTQTVLAVVPDWYHELIPKSTNHYIGYGEAKSDKEAQSLALGDIAKQISVKVKSSFSSAVMVKDNQASKRLKSNNSQQTEADLSGYEVIRAQKIRDTFYVAISYENISSFDRFVKRVKKIRPLKDEVQSVYLAQTPLANSLKKALNVKIDFTLKRKDALWYLSYKDVRVSLSKREFEKLFKSTLNASIRLGVSTKRSTIYDGETFSFKVKTQEKGYVTILTVYENGTVGTLLANTPINASQVQSIPDQDFESELQAGLLEPGVETFDLYVAIFSKEALLLDSFASADEELISHERYKNFDTLIDFMDDKTFTTLKVVTKPR
jgi:hypothetical protein